MSAAPYPGLRPFARDEVDIFFGREPQVMQLLQSLQQSPLLAVVGPSGYGKSSLVRTGLLAALETGFLATAGVHWQVALLRPGLAPFERLAESLWEEPDFQAAYAAELPQMQSTPAVSLLTATLQRGPGSLTQLLAGLNLPNKTNLLLVIDQFEEIFRYYRQGAIEQAAAFVRLLLQSAVVQADGVSVYVVLTMRSDFLGDYAVFEGLPEAINQGLFLTPRLTREQLRLAITCPAEVFGGQVEPVLVNQLLNDVGDNPDQLPVLQHALLRMWDLAAAEEKSAMVKSSDSTNADQVSAPPMLTLAHYQRIGGLQHALSRHADEILFNLPVQQQWVAELLFKCLTERDEGEPDTRRPVTLQEVVNLVAASAPMAVAVATAEVKTVIEAFRAEGCHFLTPSLDLPVRFNSVIDISHESFIRQWRRLQDWVTEEANHAEQYQRLLDAAVRYQQGKAGLWHTPELEIGLRWRASFAPTVVWAQRYAGAQSSEAKFKAALQFLDDSAAAQLADNLKRRRRTQVLVAALILAIGTAGVAFWQSWEAQWQKDAAEQAKEAVITANEQLKAQETKLLAVNEQLKTQETKLLAVNELLKMQGTQLFRIQSGFLTGLAQEHSRKGLTYTAAQLALAALPNSKQPNRPLVLEAQQALFDSFQQPGELELYDKVWSGVFSPDGKRLLIRTGDTPWLWDAQTSTPLTLLRGHQGFVYSVAFSPDGRRIVTASKDNTARLWDAVSGQLLAILQGHKAAVWSAAFSPDGRRVVTAAEDNTALLWKATGGKPLIIFKGHQDRVSSARFSPDSLRIVTASDDNTARLWDAASGALLATLKGHQGKVNSAVFSPDGSRIVTASHDATARLWDTVSGQSLAILRGHESFVDSAVFNADGSRIATASYDRTARLWDGMSGEQLARLIGHDSFVWSAVFSPDGSQLVTTSSDRTAKLWDSLSGRLLYTLKSHQSDVWSAAFSPDGTRIVTASADHTARLWNTANGAPPAVLKGHYDKVSAAVFSPTGIQIVTASWDNTLRLWDAASGKPLAILKGHQDKVRYVAFSPDGLRLVSTSEDNSARLWDTASGELLATLIGHQDYVWSAAFSSDGTRIVTASADNSARLWDSVSGTLLKTLQGHQGYVMSAVFNAEDTRILTTSFDNTARVWEAATGKLLATLTHTDKVYSAVFSPDDTRIVTASEDSTARLWETSSGEQLAKLRGHNAGVNSATFSPDGELIVTASEDNTARLWKTADGKLVTALQGHQDTVWSAVFSPDGTHILTRSADNTVRLWQTASGHLQATLQGQFRAAAFSPDGTRLVTAAENGTARIWRIFPDLASMIHAAEQRTRFHHLTCKQLKQFFLLEKSAACPLGGKHLR